MPRALWGCVLLLATTCAAARAEDAPSRDGASATDALDVDEDERWTAADPEPIELPRVRLELWGRCSAFVFARTKIGPEYGSHTIDLHRDAHLPRTPALGWRAVWDLRFHRNWLIGGQLAQLGLEGSRRRLHHTGVSLDGRYLRPLAARTELDTWLGEVFIRYVIRDNQRVRFMLGAGATWVSFRIRVSTRAERAAGRVQDVLGPSIGYHIAIELLPPLVVFAESVTALISPARFPAYASDLRVGFRLPLGGGVEVGLAFTLTSLQIEDHHDLWGGHKPRPNFRWRRASATSTGCDFGFAWRF
ncbi:MAG: hypothetical protein AB7N76_24560 [Planctomycetota bacterium]